VSRTHPHPALRSGNWKLVQFHEVDRVELYDLTADPGEQRDLAAREPARAAELRVRLAEELRRVGARFPTRSESR
jgi:arylsulfatase A